MFLERTIHTYVYIWRVFAAFIDQSKFGQWAADIFWMCDVRASERLGCSSAIKNINCKVRHSHYNNHSLSRFFPLHPDYSCRRYRQLIGAENLCQRWAWALAGGHPKNLCSGHYVLSKKAAGHLCILLHSIIQNIVLFVIRVVFNVIVCSNLIPLPATCWFQSRHFPL